LKQGNQGRCVISGLTTTSGSGGRRGKYLISPFKGHDILPLADWYLNLGRKFCVDGKADWYFEIWAGKLCVDGMERRWCGYKFKNMLSHSTKPSSVDRNIRQQSRKKFSLAMQWANFVIINSWDCLLQRNRKRGTAP